MASLGLLATTIARPVFFFGLLTSLAFLAHALFLTKLALSTVLIVAHFFLELIVSYAALIQSAVGALSYLIVGAGLYYLMAPHPVAFAAPRINMATLKKTNWKEVEWTQKLAPMRTGKKYAVIGAGFVGKKLIHSLLLRGENHIVALDMDPTACDVFKNDPRVKFIRGNVTKYEDVLAAVRGADVVFSTFAIIRYMDRLDSQAALSYNINVFGTENVIRACQECGVKALVQTSTSNVSVNGLQCTLDMDEKVDYVTRETSPNHYGWTKAIAEQLVLKADGVAGVRTGAVRPCSSVFGADDRHMLDGFLKLGRTPLPPNGGATCLDFIGVMNVVWGHLLLEKALLERPDDGVAGEAFCVSNNGPMRLIDFCHIVNYFRPGGLVMIPTPYRLLTLVAKVVEGLHGIGYKVPGQLGTLTTATVEFLELSYAFSSRKAQQRLGYEPLFTVEQAVQMSVDEWQQGQMLPALPKTIAA